MANTIRIKKRAAGGAAGAPAALRSSELAYNEQDNTLYYGYGDDGSANATSVIAISGSGSYVTLNTAQTISGDKTFTGAVDLTGATATAATQTAGTNNTTIATTAFVTAAIQGSGGYVDPLTTNGDLVYYNAGTTRLGIGTQGQVLTVSAGGLPVWSAAAGGTLTTNGDALSSGSVDLASQEITFTGGTGITTTASLQSITFDLDDTAVTANNYGTTAGKTVSFTVDQQGRLTAASEQDISITSSQVSDLGTTLGDYVSKTAVGTETMAGSLSISGDLTVNGTTTTINTTEVLVEDKNIVLGNVTTPTNVTADGGGITLKGTTDKTWNWVGLTGAWTSSEHVNIADTKSYKMNNVDVLTYNGTTKILDNVEIDGGTF